MNSQNNNGPGTNSPGTNGPGTNATSTAGGRPLSLSDRVRSLRLPDRTSAPGRRTSWLPWLLCLLLGGSTVFFALRSPGEEKSADSSSRPAIPAPQAAQPAEGGDIALTAKGYVIPVHQIQVSPKVSGMIMELFIEEGMRVPEDFVLAKLETTEYKAERDRVAASVEAAKRRLGELTEYRQQEIQQCKAELED